MSILDYLVSHGLRCNAPPSDTELQKLGAKIDFQLACEFSDFIAACNGATGFIAGDHFIQLWPIDDLLSLNPYYADVESSADLFFFGSDGSNRGYAFNKRDGHVVSIDFLEIGNREPVEEGVSFGEFLRSISTKSYQNPT